jgi:hypothetical protein
MGKLLNFRRICRKRREGPRDRGKREGVMRTPTLPGTTVLNADRPSTSVWISPKAPVWLAPLIFRALAQALESPEPPEPPVGRETSPFEGPEEEPGPGF